MVASESPSKGDRTRSRIVDDAFHLASVEGITGLTIGRLAERAGMSKSGLFAHFRSKEEVEGAVMQEAVVRFEETVVVPALQAPRGEPRLRALVERWLGWVCDACGPGGCVLIQAVSELDDRPPGRARDMLVEAQRAWLATLERVTRGAIDDRQFRRDLDPAIFAFQLEGIMLVGHQALRLHRDPDATARIWRAVDALIDGARVTSRKRRSRPTT